MLHPQVALEQLYQDFRAISSEISCFLPRMASSHFCLCFDNGHGFLLFHKRGKDRSDPPQSHMPLYKLWSVKGLQGQILVRQRALLADARVLEGP